MLANFFLFMLNVLCLCDVFGRQVRALYGLVFRLFWLMLDCFFLFTWPFGLAIKSQREEECHNFTYEK